MLTICCSRILNEEFQLQLVKYDAACHALAIAQSVDEAKDISDKSAALQAYAKQANNPDLERMAAEIRLRAKRRVGEISKGLEKAPSGRAAVSVPSNGESKNETLKAAGISKGEQYRCEKLAAVPEKEFEDYIEKTREAGKTVSSDELAKRVTASVSRQEKTEQIIKNNEALPVGEYGVIYADPPWRYEHVKTESRAIENQYPTMSLNEICALDIPAADNAILFMWATAPKLAEAMEVVTAWGFEYRTCAVWDKEKIGMGYYFRGQHELLLVGIRGKFHAPDESARVSSVHRESRGKHSAKPDYYAELIESMYPEDKRIELFCRTPRTGWAAWGNESDG